MAYSFSKKITIDNTKVSGSSDLTNFLMLFSGTFAGSGDDPDLRVSGSGGDIENTASGGITGSLTVPADFAFFSDASLTTALDFEIEKYTTTTGLIIAWVKIPTVDYNDDTVIYLGYGDSGVTTSQEDISSTWSAYGAVWHLSGTFKDSAGNADGTGNTSPTSVPTGGQIGGAYDWNGSTDNIDLDSPSAIEDLWASGGTYQAWIEPDSIGEIEGFIHSKQAASGWQFHLLAGDASNAKLTFWTDWSTTNGRWTTTNNDIPYNSKTKVSVVYNGSSASNNAILYVDGVAVSITESSTPAGSIESDVGIQANLGNNSNNGVRCFDGMMDEHRAIKTSLTAGWELTEYNNQDSPSTFYSISDPSIQIDADRDSELTGSQAIDEEHDSELTGAESVNSERSSELTGSQSISSEISSETNVVNSSERGSEISGAGVFDERNSEVNVKELITPEISSELIGSQAISDEVDSETTGSLAISDEINSEVNAKEVVNSERNSEVTGSLNISSEINSELTGSESVNSETDSEVTGAQDLTGEINSELTGVATFNERNSEMYVGTAIDAERTSQLYGIGSAERPLNYRIIVKDASGTKLGEVDNYRTVSFGKRVNNYGEANFDMDINDPKASSLISERINTIEIYRELDNSSVLVWSGEQAVADGRLDEKGNNWVEVKSYTWLEQMLHRLTEEYDDYTGIDAAQVINTLFANTQAKTDGDLGITEGTIGTTYNADIIFQNDFIYDAVLSLLDTGIDLEITDAKVLNVDVIIGEDKSDEVILEYGKNIKNMRIIRDFSKPVNDVSILGEVLGEDSLQRVQVVDTGLRSTYKLRENKINQLEPSILAIFEDKGQSLINKRGLSLIRVEFELIKNLAPSIDQFTTGDGIRLIVKDGMYDIDEQYRVFEYKITFDSKNTEKLELVLGKFITI